MKERLFFERKRGLLDFYRGNGRMPSYSEIMSLFSFRSKNAAFKLVNKFVESGIVKRDKMGRIVPTCILGQLKILGSVEAGFPSPAEEELIDTISLDEFLIKNPETTFMLKVSGDSMVDAGIMPNDLVLVERGRVVKSGDIVVASVDGEWTLKHYIKKGGQIMLKPANKKYESIIPQGELMIGGVVSAVIRRY